MLYGLGAGGICTIVDLARGKGNSRVVGLFDIGRCHQLLYSLNTSSDTMHNIAVSIVKPPHILTS